MQKNRIFFAVIGVLMVLMVALPASILAATRSKNGITISYPDGPNCLIGQDQVSVSASLAPAGGVRFDFFGAIVQGGQLTYIATITDVTSPFEVIVPYDSQYPYVAVFAALLDAQGNPVQGQKISAQWNCTFVEPTATPTALPPTPTPEPPTPTPDVPGQGCTPGYWKQPHHIESWPSAYAPGNSYNGVFGVSSSFGPTFTLLEALELGGGGENALARHAVAALLNAAHPNVNYIYSTESQVISMVQQAYAPPPNYEPTKDLFDAANNTSSCPLN
jgi:hypothetical protein